MAGTQRQSNPRTSPCKLQTAHDSADSTHPWQLPLAPAPGWENFGQQQQSPRTSEQKVQTPELKGRFPALELAVRSLSLSLSLHRIGQSFLATVPALPMERLTPTKNVFKAKAHLEGHGSSQFCCRHPPLKAMRRICQSDVSISNQLTMGATWQSAHYPSQIRLMTSPGRRLRPSKVWRLLRTKRTKRRKTEKISWNRFESFHFQGIDLFGGTDGYRVKVMHYAPKAMENPIRETRPGGLPVPYALEAR